MSDQTSSTPTPPLAPVITTKPPIPIEVYYYGYQNKYLVLDNDKNWIHIDSTGVKHRLAMCPLHLRGRATKNEIISPADAMLVRVQNERHVGYAGGLAGFKRGIHVINGIKNLVTSEPVMVEAKAGEWATLRRVFEQQLAPRTPDEPDQWTYLMGTLKLWDEQLRACLETGYVTWSHVLILTGPRGCGKTLIQQIITWMLGGRKASPFRYMMGKTEFNAELFESEHLCISDEQPSTDIRVRIAFGEAIKQIAANPDHTHHGKCKDGRTATPFWRLSISANDEPDHIEVLPPLHDICDKAIVLHCRMEPMPMPTGSVEEKRAFEGRLKAELPAFLHWLRHEFTLPESYKADRYGIKPFIHPYVTTLLDDLLPETRLLALIDHILFMDKREPWYGSSEELSRLLMADFNYGNQAKSLVANSTTCGRLLAKLARSHPDRVKQQRESGFRGWDILPPTVAAPAMSTKPITTPDGFLEGMTMLGQ